MGLYTTVGVPIRRSLTGQAVEVGRHKHSRHSSNNRVLTGYWSLFSVIADLVSAITGSKRQ